MSVYFVVHAELSELSPPMTPRLRLSIPVWESWLARIDSTEIELGLADLCKWSVGDGSANVDAWRQLYKIRSSRKIDSRRLFTREYDFPKTLSLTENQFSGKAYLYTIRPCALQPLFGLHDPLPDAIPQVLGRGGGGGGRGHEE